MVTPSACSTTRISTSDGSLFRPRFSATTSTSRPGAPEASMDPFTPTISIVLPSARGPCHRKVLPWADWVGTPATLAENSSRVRSIGDLLSGFRRPGWLAKTAEVSSPGPEGPWRSLRDGFAAGAARRDGSYGRPLGRDSRQPLDTAARALVGSIFRHDRPRLRRHPRPDRHDHFLQGLAPGGGPPNAHEQPRPGGGRAARGAHRLWGRGQGGEELGLLREDRGDAPAPRERRDAAGAERKAGRGLPHPRSSAPRPDRQRAPGAALGHGGRVPPAGCAGPHDVRPDDRGLLD